MNRTVQLVLAVALIFSFLPMHGRAAELDPLRRKQQAQEKARALARELVSSILDIQIRQFEENGLSTLPIFKEVRDMRGNLDGLVEKEMQGIVQLLVKAQDAGKDEQLAIINQARGKIREVVVRLMAERQKLLRRLQIARIAAQVRQLILMETKALNVTQALPTMAENDRDPRTRRRSKTSWT